MAAMNPPSPSSGVPSVSPSCLPGQSSTASAPVDGRAYMPPAKRTNWATPPALFDALAAEFGPFDLDPCGAADSYASQHCGTYHPARGLEQPWWGRVFLNPPYGRELKRWVARCSSAAHPWAADLVVALLPARTDTIWWHTYIGDHCQYPAEVRFLKGRVKFVGAKASAPFPSVIVVWRKAAV